MRHKFEPINQFSGCSQTSKTVGERAEELEVLASAYEFPRPPSYRCTCGPIRRLSRDVRCQFMWLIIEPELHSGVFFSHLYR